MRILVGLFTLVMLLMNCSNANLKNDYQVRKETDGNYEIKRGMSMSPGKDNEKLEQGKYLLIKKSYKKAEKAFFEVYNEKSVEDKYKEEALLLLGDLYSNFLNPGKDYKKAVSYYNKLIKEFPDTKLKDKAEEKIKDINSKL